MRLQLRPPRTSTHTTALSLSLSLSLSQSSHLVSSTPINTLLYLGGPTCSDDWLQPGTATGA